MIEKHSILGQEISGVTFSELQELIRQNDYSIPKYICFTNVHALITGRKLEALKRANKNAWLSLADGKPVAILGNILYEDNFERITGHQLLLELINSRESKLTHYFYGSFPDTVEKRKTLITPRLGDRLKGCFSPPFHQLKEVDIQEHFNIINRLRPDILWVGLGAPKQEIFMKQNLFRLEHGIMIGVGAAFNFLAGEIKRAPTWMQNNGLEWLFRLCQEPGRLWKRYLVTNNIFIFLTIKEIIKHYVKKLR